LDSSQAFDSQKTKSRPGRDLELTVDHCSEKRKLRSATLTIAILVFFVFVLRLTLARLFRLGLAGLLVLLVLLAGLATLLALSELAALLPLLLHIVCHEIFLLGKGVRPGAPF
jgi:hypothetical protein